MFQFFFFFFFFFFLRYKTSDELGFNVPPRTKSYGVGGEAAVSGLVDWRMLNEFVCCPLHNVNHMYHVCMIKHIHILNVPCFLVFGSVFHLPCK